MQRQSRCHRRRVGREGWGGRCSRSQVGLRRPFIWRKLWNWKRIADIVVVGFEVSFVAKVKETEQVS